MSGIDEGRQDKPGEACFLPYNKANHMCGAGLKALPTKKNEPPQVNSIARDPIRGRKMPPSPDRQLL